MGHLTPGLPRVRASALLTAGLVLAAGLGLTVTSAGAVADAAARAAAAGADRDAERASAAVTGEMRRYQDTVSAVAASLSAQQDLTAADFDTVTAPLRQVRFAGASGIVFVVPSDDAGVAGVRDYWATQGAAGLVPQPAGTGTHYFVVYSRIFDDVPVPGGLDMARSPQLVGALERSRRSGEVAITDTYVLLKDRQLRPERQQLSFALAAPVTTPPGADDPGAAAGPGGRPLRGWVLMGLRGVDLLRGVLEAATEGRAVVTLTAVPVGAAMPPPGAPVPPGAATGVVARLATGAATDPALVRTTVLPVADNFWVLRTQSTDAAARADTGGGRQAGLVLLGGSSVTVLLALVLLLVMTSRTRALAAVERRTGQLREAEQQARSAEQESRRQAALLTAVMDSISDGVGVVDETGAFLLHNPAAKQLLGVTDDNDDSEAWQAHYGIYRPDGVTPFPTAELPLVQALQGLASDQVEMVIRPDGADRGTPISVSARPLDPRAGVAGAVAVFHDLTARLAAEAELRAAEECFRFSFDHAHVGMAVNDLTGDGPPDGPTGVTTGGAGRFVRVNGALCAMLGYRAEELRRRTLLDVVHPDDREALAALLAPGGWPQPVADAGRDGAAASTVTLEQRYVTGGGQTVYARVNSTLIRDPEGRPHYAITQVEDITARRAETARLSALALQDPLTGLGNRAMIRDRLRQAAARTARTRRSMAVLFCDLDDFKPVNDTYGHAAGDEVLRKVAFRLRQAVRPTDAVARVGGDEFVVLCEELESEAAANHIVRRITAAVEAPIVLSPAEEMRGGSRVTLTVRASIGVTTAGGPGVDVDDILRRADAAMYALKRRRAPSDLSAL